MKTNIFWLHCLWLYSCRGSESTLESTYTSSISKVVNGRMAHQGPTISMCSCFLDASFSFCHLSLSKVKRTSQVILFLKYSHNWYQTSSKTAQIIFLTWPQWWSFADINQQREKILLKNRWKTIFFYFIWLSLTHIHLFY